MRTATSRRRTLAAFAAIAIAAIVLIGLVVANVLRPSASPPGGFASASPTATASASQQAVASSAPTSSVAATPPTSTIATAVRPDARHGVIVPTGNLRTEDDERGLQQPSLFMTAPTTTYAVSPDGKRIALIRASQTGQQIVTFTTARPNDITVVADLAGSGERATNIVWAGDGSDYVVYSVDGGPPPSISYSALRSIDLAAKKQSEIARITSGLHLVALSWRFDTHVGGAVEQETPANRLAAYYVIDGNALTQRTPLAAASLPRISASRDGRRVVVSSDTSVRWWPVDQPAKSMELAAQQGETLGRAEFRPGTDEIGVDRVGPAGQFEIWTLTQSRP